MKEAEHRAAKLAEINGEAMEEEEEESEPVVVKQGSTVIINIYFEGE